MKKTIILILVAIFIILILLIILRPDHESNNDIQMKSDVEVSPNESLEETNSKENEKAKLHPMSIEALRQMEYPGGNFTIEETLQNGSNYSQAIISYLSENLRIYGLLTVPLAEKPVKGFPAIVFIHGYIPPKLYSTTGDYPTYQATLARSGFVTFKPDLRGHGNSEGEPVSAHFSEKYIVDTMNAISYMKNHREIDPERIGYWGHSNGGEIGLRVAVISDDIKAYSFWAGVVGSYEDMFETYNSKIPFLRDANENKLIQENYLPSQNPDFWNKLDPYTYLQDIKVPIQLQHGTNDSSVPIELSKELGSALQESDKNVEYFEYQGDDHNIGQNSSVAWRRTIDFFRSNL